MNPNMQKETRGSTRGLGLDKELPTFSAKTPVALGRLGSCPFPKSLRQQLQVLLCFEVQAKGCCCILPENQVILADGKPSATAPTRNSSSSSTSTTKDAGNTPSQPAANYQPGARRA